MKNKTFVSETDLALSIQKNWTPNILEKELDSEILSYTQMDILIINLRKNIQLNAKRLLKRIKSKLESKYNKDNYINLRDKEWYKAAMITEIFRENTLFKNSNELNEKELQNKIYNLLKSNKITLVISWGQAKRSCGKLKTDGYNSDYSELYSIYILQSIIECIHNISEKDVDLIVTSGGNRFYPALFTNKEKSVEYDKQRNIFAKKLESTHSKITFKHYDDEYNNSNNLMKYITKVGEIEESENLLTILMNIDWNNIIEKNIQPHNEKVPDSIYKLISNGWNVDRVIEMAITSIIKKEINHYWIKLIGDHTIFDEIIDFFYTTALISTRKYIAIHLMNNSTPNGIYPSDTLRLTVHKKEDRQNIPAIYLLGLENRNKLSQHTCAVFNGEQFEFISKLEMLSRKNKFRKIHVDHKDFYWLSNKKQPLFYVIENKNNFIDIISNYNSLLK